MIDVLAHGVGGRTDLPIPTWLAIYGAGIAVVLSFAALGVLWPTPRLGEERGRALPRWLAAVVDSQVLLWLLRAVVLAWTVLLVFAAFLGGPSEDSNPVPWFLYAVFWPGIVLVSLLLGPFWRAVNPLRTIHLGISAAVGSDPEDGVRELPAGVGYWPGAAFLTGFVWLELVVPDRSAPRTLGVLFVLYAAVHLVAASVYGGRWFARADAFEVYSTLVGRLAPFGRLPDGRLSVRNPLRGLSGIVPEPGLVAFVVVLLGSTAFDGVTRAQWWADVSGDAGGWAAVPVHTAGLVACCLVVAVTYVGATRLAGRPAGAGPRRLPGAFVHSVVPIAVGYAIAHYFTLFMFEGQQAWIFASDPFATGADWFGTAGWLADYGRVSPRVVSLVQIGSIVVGHVVGVVAAHDRAITLFKGRAAVRGQYPLLAVMVVYTLGGVALLLGT